MVPMGVVGVLLAFSLHSVPINVLALIGIMGLIGVVVNDTIIMLDEINKKRASGDPVF
jgi:multidrug efflux pump subunit AcrB